MSSPPIDNLVHSIDTYTWMTNGTVQIRGGWATGKTELAARVSLEHVAKGPGIVWLVGDTVESARHLHNVVSFSASDGRDRVLVFSAEDYAEALTGALGPSAPPEPTLIVYDDADRYRPTPMRGAASVWITNSTATHPVRDEVPRIDLTRGGVPRAGASYELGLTRTRDVTVRTMHELGFPGLAAVGTPTSIHLAAQEGTRAGMLATALRIWGLAGIYVPLRRGRSDATTAVLRNSGEVIKTLARMTTTDVTGSRLHKVGSPRTSLSLSDQRSGLLGAVSPAETQAGLVPALLEDLAGLRPDVVVIGALDADLEHLARLASTARIGAVVVTSDPRLRDLLRPVYLQNW